MELLQRRCYICIDTDKNIEKYYIIEIHEENEDYFVTTKYGKLGKAPRTKQTKMLSDYEATTKLIDTIIDKENKGYEEVDISDIVKNGDFIWEK